MEENEFILESARRMEAWEKTPKPVGDDYADMDRDELIRLIIYQRERMEEADAARKESDRRISELTDRISDLTEMLRQSNEHASVMASQLSGLVRDLKEKDRKIAELESRGKVARKNLFGRKSQKGTKAKDKDNGNGPTPHTDVKDSFDGTPESLPENLDVDRETASDATADAASLPSPKECRLNRLGLTYRTMSADRKVCHSSDRSKLPEGAVVIKTYKRYAYDQQTTITEHSYEIVVYKDKDGQVRSGYFPLDESEPVIESVPGTHASPGLLSHLVFNRFFLDTPVYRETERLLQEYMRVSRQTITNWLGKGAECMKGIIGKQSL